jgi:hypothetical protein
MDIEQMLSHRLFQQFINSITAPLQDWLLTHPLWNWLFTHPIWLLGLVVLSLLLFIGLISAVAHLTEAVWLAILQLPLRLVRWTFIGTVALFKLPFNPKFTIAPAPHPDNPTERLALILSRIETIHQEQNELLAEVRSILAAQSILATQRSDSKLNPPQP